MTRPNRDLDQAGHTLQSVIALNLTNALEHIARELSILDGFPERGEQANVQATSELTSVERHADARYALTEARETLRDHKAQVLQSIRELNEYINVVMRMRQPRNTVQPHKVTLCMDGLTDATRPGSLEWHDAACRQDPVTRGLCKRHYDAMRYWRRTNGLSELPESPLPEVSGLVRSTAEVLVRDGELGAAHAYPARPVHTDA